MWSPARVTAATAAPRSGRAQCLAASTAKMRRKALTGHAPRKMRGCHCRRPPTGCAQAGAGFTEWLGSTDCAFEFTVVVVDFTAAAQL
mmetsp:Transcript_99013/g.280445  ORF Transcript_99013/g.280445 Transcript_99013/m.280445 type:complete len:88 (-) Transcript_99013:237-500(-)